MPSEREVRTTRAFDAPRNLVFDAWTKPELLKRWYGPRGWSLLVCKIDLRIGGEFRLVSTRPDGKEIGQRGVYREIVAPTRLVNTEWWEDWNPGESVVTTLFEEAEGRTTLTSTILFPSKEVRDVVVESGLQDGAAETYDRLAELLATMTTRRALGGTDR
ncbi:MAG: SRPBCC family protein [Chloroflexota bacterium]